MLFRRITCILLLIVSVLSAEANPFRFFSTDQGLSSLLVTHLYQDRYGMMWIGTEDGLNRYDGVKITSYRHNDADSASLASDYVRQILEDEQGNLAVSTYAGIQLYRRATDDFSPVACLADGHPLPENVTLLGLMPDGGLLAAGIMPCRIVVDACRERLQLQRLPWQIPFHKSGHIAQDAQRNLWILSDDSLTGVVIPDGKVVCRVPLPAGGDGRLDKMVSAGVDEALYLASHGNLYRISLGEGLEPVDGSQQISTSSIRALARYDSTHLLIGTDSEGLYLLDEEAGISAPYYENLHLRVHHMLRDHEGGYWIGRYLQGVIQLGVADSPFHQLAPKVGEEGVAQPSSVLTLSSDGDRGYWVGTDGDGLYHLDTEMQHWTYEQQAPPIVNEIFEDSRGNMWLGSYGYPCYRRRAGQQRFEPVTRMFGIHGHSPCVFAMAEDGSQRLWFGTMGNGLYCYDLSAECNVGLNQGNMNPWINDVLNTRDGHVLVGTYNGIYAFDTQDPQRVPTHHCQQQIVHCLYQDSADRLWAGTSRGLLGFGLNQDSIRSYTVTQGLPSNAVYAIVEDDGRLWCSTGNGLVSLDVDQPDEGIEVYGTEDGLQSNAYSKGASLRTSDGHLWFGGSQGVTWFDPKHISISELEIHPRISALYLDGQPASVNTLTGGQPVMDRAIYECTDFSLAHDANSFSLELSTIELGDLSLVTFSYSVDGAAWVTLPRGQHLVNFSQLRRGRHLFQYRATMGDSASETQMVHIRIRYPWWISPIAIICYLVALVALLLFLIQWWKNKTKLRLLTLISHQIRTPLTLIVNPLQQLMGEETDPQRLQVYQRMLRNANRMRFLAEKVTEEVPLGAIEEKRTEESPATVPPAETSPRQPRKGYEVLIVDDDEEMRQYLAEQFAVECRVRVATQGQEALEMIFERRPDAVISDVTMPVMDGIALCRKLKRNIQLAHIPVILLTARADQESTLQGLGIGADAYITKPFSIQILKQTVHNIIELRKQLRNLYNGQQLQENHLEQLEADDYDNRLMERIMQVVNQELANPELNAEMLCDKAGMSRTQLYRKLKEKTNQSVAIFIRNVRLKQSEQLLRQPNMRIGEVAEQVGFKDLSYFVKQFKEVYGVTPSQWKEKNEVL